MNLLFAGVPQREPTELHYQWVVEAGRLLLEVHLSYACLTEAETAALLGAGVKDLVALSCPDPRTGGNLSLNMRCASAAANTLLEQEGELRYGPVTLVLREMPPGT